MEGSTLPDLAAVTLLIEDLELRIRVGVGAAERSKPQRLLVTLKAEVTPLAPREDDVAEVVDYGVIAAGLRRLAAREVKLLETLAGEMAEVAFADPRVPGLAPHVLPPAAGAPAAPASMHDWHAHRIALGGPESGLDFAIGDTFPHDADMDDLCGVDFKKGCFIGQEVVSRMKHRGTARKRIVIARALEARPAWPDAGTEITCGEKTLGTLGSSADGLALALVRLDRAKEAIDMGDAIEVGGVTVALELPEYATFHWPETAEG